MKRTTQVGGFSIEMALSAKNKLSFVDESLPKSQVPSASYAIWNRCNNMVASGILNSIFKYKHLYYYKNFVIIYSMIYMYESTYTHLNSF